MTTVYLAARYSRREELCLYADDLRRRGHEVTSRWLAGAHQVSDAGLSEEGTPEERQRFAEEDWADLRRAHVCIAFSEEPRVSNSRGGRHVELGAALAWGKRVLIVGPAENVFMCLSQVERFEEWEQCVEALTPSRISNKPDFNADNNWGAW